MEKVDFIESVSRSYVFLWEKRKILLQMVLIPFLIKTLMFFIVFFLQLEDNHLRAGLVLLPSYVAEGWFIAQTIRLLVLLNPSVFLNMPIAAQPESIDSKAQKQLLLATVLIYVLLKVLASLVFGGAMMLATAQSSAVEANDGAMNAFFVLAMVFVYFFVWGFRYLWPYIPVAMGFTLPNYLRAVHDFKSSFYMMGIWLLCFIPCLIALILISQILLTVIPPISETQNAPLFSYIMIFIQSAFDLLISVLASIAMAFYLQGPLSETMVKNKKQG